MANGYERNESGHRLTRNAWAGLAGRVQARPNAVLFALNTPPQKSVIDAYTRPGAAHYAVSDGTAALAFYLLSTSSQPRSFVGMTSLFLRKTQTNRKENT